LAVFVRPIPVHSFSAKLASFIPLRQFGITSLASPIWHHQFGIADFMWRFSLAQDGLEIDSCEHGIGRKFQ
jgi:hypothetical protein